MQRFFNALITQQYAPATGAGISLAGPVGKHFNFFHCFESVEGLVADGTGSSRGRALTLGLATGSGLMVTCGRQRVLIRVARATCLTAVITYTAPIGR